MIERLKIDDLGVISSAEVEFGPGLSVVTGETGAGKTMVVTALGLLLGARADSGRVRAGADRAVVEGDFALPEPLAARLGDRVREAGGDLDGEVLTLARILSEKGRSRAVAGGRTVPNGVLGELGEHLVSVHGQTEQLTLRQPAAQRALLDRFGGQPLARALDRYQDAYAAWKDSAATLAELTASESERHERIAQLRRALEEIAEVRPEPGEDVALANLSQRLGAHEELRQAAQLAHDALAGGDAEETPCAVDLVEQARRAVDAAASSDSTLTAHQETLADLSYRLADAAQELSGYLSDLGEAGEADIEQIEGRRARLASLRVYGETADEVLAYEERAAAELLRLENDDASLEGLADRTEELAAALAEAGAVLRAERERAAAALEEDVAVELAALAMPGARLSVQLDEPGEPGPHGTEGVRIRLQQHAGAQPQDIAKTASGGELSRVMLALEVVIGEVDPVPTFVFDEVDAGVGGRAAVEIGRRLARLARHSQVLVVTHLPQVAAWADAHINVVKATGEETGHNAPISGVERLDDAQRAAELARMLAGQDESEVALAHARELIASAREEMSSW